MLAPPDARCVAIIGAGVQARSQLAALRLVREITSVQIFDSSLEAAQRFSLDTACAGLSVAVADSVDRVLPGAHIAITSTWRVSHSCFGAIFTRAYTLRPSDRISPESVSLLPRFSLLHVS